MSILIKGGSVIASSEIKKQDILIKDDKIVDIRVGIEGKFDNVIDASGLIVMSGLVDMHTHLREPGYEYKEDINTGAKAAVKGGFTSIACMPNTMPVCDNEAVVSFIKDTASKAGYAKVYPIGAITKGSKGEELAELYTMKKAGIVAASDDGKPVMNGNTMLRAMEYSKSIDLLIISHCEDLNLAAEGYVNEGYNSTICGLKGITRVAEELMVMREILLAETLNTRVHIAHVSTKGSVELIRQAKLRNVKVTAETCPHYFALTDDKIINFDTNAKVNPPLREENDKLAIIEGLRDGTIDVIATDHAPHHRDDKQVEFAAAAFGISGLETAFSIAYTCLVKPGYIDIIKLNELMSVAPAKIIGINSGISIGNAADITIIDPSDKYLIDSRSFISKGKNTPFNGYEAYGSVQYTIIDGKIILNKGQF